MISSKKSLEFTCLRMFNNLFDENFEKSIEIYLLKNIKDLIVQNQIVYWVFVDLF